MGDRWGDAGSIRARRQRQLTMGMLEEVRIHRLVERLLADRAEGAEFDSTWDSSLTPQSMAESYRVQDSVIRRTRSRGNEPGGWRIALTTDAAQKRHGVVHPIVGPIWRGDIRESPAALPVQGGHEMVAGAELALRVSRTMPADDGPWNRESVRPCIGTVAVAISVVDDRRVTEAPDYSIGLVIADLAGAVAGVLGAEHENLDDLELDAASLTTALDGREIGSTSTSSYLAHPYEILSWVATHLNFRRRQLEAGDVVLLGPPGEPLPLGPGDRLSVTHAVLGSAELVMEEPSDPAWSV